MITGHPLPADVASDPAWLVQAIDPHERLARLVRMDDQAYREASFLDDRILAAGGATLLCNLDELIASAGAVASPPAGWIFHIGHVGSTLVSRLLGELDGVLAIREPRSLRDLGSASEDERPALAKALARLMARRAAGHRAVVVKATSFVSEYAPLLVEPEAPVLFLFASPAKYVAGILAGENSVKELAALFESRVARLKSRGIQLHGFDGNDAARAALSWACEMTSLEAAAGTMPTAAILWADFDAMLGVMAGGLCRVAQHFSLDAPSERIQELATGPLMGRYSKALEYDYSPSLRAELLADVARHHVDEIDAAIAALWTAAESMPLLKRALERAGTEC